MVGEILMRGVRRFSGLAAATLCLAACSGMQPTPEPPDSKTIVRLPAVAEALAISTTDFTTDGRFAKVRGRVKNPHAEDVSGIRYLVRIETRGSDPRTLDRFQFDTNDRLPPGQEAAMRLDIESMYFGTASQLAIVAMPKKLGDRTVALPEDWK